MLFLLFSFLLKLRKIYKIIQIIRNINIIYTKDKIQKYKIIQHYTTCKKKHIQKYNIIQNIQKSI